MGQTGTDSGAGPVILINTHAALPVSQAFGDRSRLFFSLRRPRSIAHRLRQLSLDNPSELLDVSETPVMSPGLRQWMMRRTTACLVDHKGCRNLLHGLSPVERPFLSQRAWP